MKKVKLLCLLALLFAVGTAFTTSNKDTTLIYPISTGFGLTQYHWVTELPDEEECEIPKETPCFIELKEGITVPADDTLPDDEDREDEAEENAAYPPAS